MNKKFINALLFSAALLSTGMVSSCKDYDDDIDALETRVTTLEEAMKTLEAKFDAGKFITSFAANSSNTGYVLTLSDGSTLEIKNGENGATGAAGQNGTTWEIDETTKEWVKVNPDGSRENTGIIAEGQKGEQGEPGEPGQPGKDGHSPYINETNQKWMVWNDETGKYEETQYSAVGESSYVVKYDNYYELNVAIADANGVPTGQFQKILLPVTATVSSLKVYTADADQDNKFTEGAEVDYAYSYNQQGKAVEFNGKTYEANQVLSSAAATFIAEINPRNADATKYGFFLTDSKGNSDFVISSISQNKTKDAIITTRAAEKEPTVNYGFYNMSIRLKDGINLNDINTGVSYALATINYNGGIVTSDYTININVDDNINGKLDKSDFSAGPHDVSVEEGISFDELLKAVLGKKALNIADFYFTLPQNQTANNEEPQFSIDLANRKISAKNASSSVVTLKLHYLTINGTVVEGEDKAIDVKVKAISAQEASIGDFTWTIQKSSKAEDMKAVVDVTGLKNYIPTSKTANVTYKFANEVVYVNGVALSPKAKADIEADINNRTTDNILPGTLKFVQSNEVDEYGYYTYTAELDFTNYVSTIYAEPFIAEVTLTNNKNPEEKTTFSFMVNIKAPEYTLDRSKAYFSGDNALVLDQNGDWSAVDGILHFDLTKLYANFNGNATATDGSKISFKETVPNKNDKGEPADAWLQDSKTIYVGEFNEDKENGIYNTGAGSERTFDVTCVPFGNKNLELVKETIVVKASTRVHEGIFGYGKFDKGVFKAGEAKEITNTEVVKVKVRDFAGMEAETETEYNFVGEFYDFRDNNKYSAKIQGIKIEGDDNAKQNLDFTTEFKYDSSAQESVFTVQKKVGVTVQTETTCNITVTITDRLGLTKSAVVPVILKPTAVAGE